MRKRKNTDEKFYTFLSALFIMALIGGMVAMVLFIKPLEKFDKQYCYQIQKQAEDYKNFTYSEDNPGGFYITKADKQMCNRYKIDIKAPVRK